MTSFPNVIGFSGKLGSGKDYIAKNILPTVLKQVYNIDFDIRIVAFADQLKYEVSARDASIDYDKLYVKKSATVRKQLQEYGTENGRDKYGNDMWIQALQMRMRVDMERHIGEQPLIFVVTDVRYENEAKFIESCGLLIRIHAPIRNGARLKDEGTEHLATHRSEISLEKYPFKNFIANDPDDASYVDKSLQMILGGHALSAT